MMIPIVLGALNFIVQLNGVKPVLGIFQFLLILYCIVFILPNQHILRTSNLLLNGLQKLSERDKNNPAEGIRSYYKK